jgi:hypothetical protein
MEWLNLSSALKCLMFRFPYFPDLQSAKNNFAICKKWVSTLKRTTTNLIHFSLAPRKFSIAEFPATI